MEAQDVLFDEPVEVEAKPVQATALAKQEHATTAVAAPQSETGALLSMLQSLVTNESVSIERVNQAFDFYQRVQADAARKAFQAAMAAAKAEFGPIVKRHLVEYGEGTKKTSYKHEDLADIAVVVDPILARHGLFYRHKSDALVGKPVKVTCIISHRDGYSEETTLEAAPDASGGKNGIQAVGSTCTYLQRYTLRLGLGLSTGRDDDGRRAEIKSGDVDPLATISDEQQATIKQLLKDTGSDTGRFLAWAGAEMVSDILASKFGEAVKMLNAKKKGASK